MRCRHVRFWRGLPQPFEQPLRCPALVVASTDDPYCTAETAATFAAGWQARLHQLAAHGHINSSSGLGAWQRGRELLADLLSQG